MKSLQPDTAVPLNEVDSNWQTSLLHPLSITTSGDFAGVVVPGVTYAAVGSVTSTCTGVPSKLLTRPVQTSTLWPPVGVNSCDWVSCVAPSLGQAGAASATAGGTAAKTPAVSMPATIS